MSENSRVVPLADVKPPHRFVTELFEKYYRMLQEGEKLPGSVLFEMDAEINEMGNEIREARRTIKQIIDTRNHAEKYGVGYLDF